MHIKEIKHSVQAVISTGAYENQREMFELLATLKEGEDPKKAMQELEEFNHSRLDMAVNRAKTDLIEKQYASIRFYEKDGKKYPSVTSILGWSIDWKISEDELQQYGSRGSIVHKIVETYLKGQKWVEPDDLPELKEDIAIVCGGSLGLSWKDCTHKAFFEQHGKDIEVDKIEQEVFNDESLYAGRYDFKGKYKGVEALFDIKTGNTSDFRQLAAYAVCESSIKNLIICPVGATDNKSGYMKPKVCDTIQAEYKAFLKARTKFKSRFGI